MRPEDYYSARNALVDSVLGTATHAAVKAGTPYALPVRIAAKAWRRMERDGTREEFAHWADLSPDRPARLAAFTAAGSAAAIVLGEDAGRECPPDSARLFAEAAVLLEPFSAYALEAVEFLRGYDDGERFKPSDLQIVQALYDAAQIMSGMRAAAVGAQSQTATRGGSDRGRKTTGRR